MNDGGHHERDHPTRHIRPSRQDRCCEAAGRARRCTSDPLGTPVDIFENRHGITLYADLPGVPREKLDVRVQDGTLTVDAELLVPTPAGLRLQHGEVRHPHFSRTFVLSPDFDASRIDAQLRDGVLKLTIPRRDEAKPRRIEVQAG